MSEMISYCGLNCQTCQIYLATREQNEEKKYQMRAEIARQIKELYSRSHLSWHRPDAQVALQQSPILQDDG